MLVVSMHDELLHAERVIRAGSRLHHQTGSDPQDHAGHPGPVLNGDVYLSEKMAARIAAGVVGSPRRDERLPVAKLSDRELRVFEMIGQGQATRQIADELHLDMRTIETYRARIKDKLNLKNANEFLLQYAIR